jgi:hypothetical protein
MKEKRPQIDLICNVVIRRPGGDVLLARYEAEDPRWWLPGRGLVPYEHPDEVASKIVADLGLSAKRVAFTEVESFRGRTGWHVMFNYVANVGGEPAGGVPCGWFAAEALPPLVHGKWEKDVIKRSMAKVPERGTKG